MWCCVSANVSVLIAYRPKSDHELCALLRRKLEVVRFIGILNARRRR